MDTYLLPDELWLSIFRHIQSLDSITFSIDSISTISSLCLTCRHFSRICQPIRSEQFLIGQGMRQVNDGDRRCFERLEALNSLDPDQKSQIRTLRYSGTADRGRDPANTDETPLLQTALTQLDRLESLALQLTAIRAPLFQVVAALPRLTSLSLNSCKFHEDFPDTAFSQVGSFKTLKKLEMRLRDGVQGPYLFPSHFDAPVLETMDVDPIVIRHAGHRVSDGSWSFPNLRALTVTSGISVGSSYLFLEALNKVFAHCPDLEEVDVNRCFPLEVALREPTQLDGLGQLKRFRGRPAQASSICAGRPVEELYLESMEYGKPAGLPLELVSIGTAPLKVLDLHGIFWEADHLTTIVTKCPDLESLSIFAPNYSSYTPVSNFPSMPHLRSLVMLEGHCDNDQTSISKCGHTTVSLFKLPKTSQPREAVEHEILEEFIAACPALEELRLHPTFYWKNFGVADGWERIADPKYMLPFIRRRYHSA